MRGYAFTLFVSGLFVLSAIILATLLHFIEASPSNTPSQLQARINASLAHLYWEYKGKGIELNKIDTSKGCVPVVILPLRGDPVESLARPIIYYQCGG